jgi:GNAT superfamily N-acetyltransferase
MPAHVRDARGSDAAAIREVAVVAWRDTYAALLQPGTIGAFIEAAYSVEMLERRIARHVFLVAEDEGHIIAFANATVLPDPLNLAAIYALPERPGSGVGTALLQELRARFPSLPVAADVLSGNRKGEVFYERRGFIPREVLEDELYGEPVIERRGG